MRENSILPYLFKNEEGFFYFFQSKTTHMRGFTYLEWTLAESNR
jgi:hypothetical protein